jgi:hypothetical protein
MAAPVFPPMGTDPSIPLMSRSAEFATFNPTNQPSSSAGSNAVQPQTENAGPLSEEVLLNGGTMLEIPMMQAAGTTVATSDAQSSAPVELTVNTTVSSVEAEKAALKAQGERNLERLRLARDQAFRG